MQVTLSLTNCLCNVVHLLLRKETGPNSIKIGAKEPPWRVPVRYAKPWGLHLAAHTFIRLIDADLLVTQNGHRVMDTDLLVLKNLVVHALVETPFTDATLIPVSPKKQVIPPITSCSMSIMSTGLKVELRCSCKGRLSFAGALHGS